MIYPALCWLGPGVLISNEPRDSTINYIQRSAIRQQTGHFKKKKSPWLCLTFPPSFAEILKNNTAHILVDTHKFGKMVTASGPNMGCGVGRGVAISWSCNDWEMEGQGFGKELLCDLAKCEEKFTRSSASSVPWWTRPASSVYIWQPPLSL